MTWVSPPPGWYPFGFHAGGYEQIQFSDEQDEDGLPRWERVVDSWPPPFEEEPGAFDTTRIGPVWIWAGFLVGSVVGAGIVALAYTAPL